VAISLRTVRQPGVGGACRSEGLVAGEHVPDRFRELDKVVWRLPIPLYDPDIPSTADSSSSRTNPSEFRLDESPPARASPVMCDGSAARSR
jgi:hypothetical protein